MQTEVHRKLDLIVRIEETLAQIVNASAARVEDPVMKDHLHEMMQHHADHAAELMNAGVHPASAAKLDIEMDTYKRHAESASGEREIIQTLSNFEREQRTRITEILSEHLDRDLVTTLNWARTDIERDLAVFSPYTPKERAHYDPGD